MKLRRKISHMKTLIIPLAIALTLTPMARGDFDPIPITPGSFTHDIVVEKTALPPLGAFTSAAMDGGTNNTGATWFEQGFSPGQPWCGLPPAGTTFAAANAPNHTFKMPANYAAKNALLISTQVRTGTLTLANPVALWGISILNSCGNGPETITVTVRHQDGSFEPADIVSLDWHNGADPAWAAMGRINLDNGGFQNINLNGSAGVPKLFYNDLLLTNITSPVVSIDFAYVSGGRASIFAISGSSDNANFDIPLAITGFNQDMVVEAAAAALPTALFTATTATLENGAANFGNAFFEIGFDRSNPTRSTYGLPHPGATFTNSAGNHAFTMAPSYTANNALLINAETSGTFSLSTPAAYSALSLLTCATGGAIPISVTVFYADYTVEIINASSPDWFASGTPAFNPKGTFSTQNAGFNNINSAGNAGVLWAVDLLLANTVTPVASVAVNFAGAPGNRHAVVLALGGKTAGSGVFFGPVAVTGYNADIVVEKEQTLWWGNSQTLWPPGLFTATTASMDNGTNNFAWTWYERGYNPNATNTGLPPAGSILDSQTHPDRHYKMPATYVGPNAVLIDTNHPIASITPITADSYTTISLLTAGASIGGNNIMTNVCVLQHADGTGETNVFYGYDWFNSQAAPAFIANGRVNLNGRFIGNQYGNNPRLFETQFVLANTVSPVTNILVGYKLAGGANWTTYVLAVTGSKDSVAPVFALPAVPSMTVFEGTNLTFTATAAGTPTITYAWQFSTDGTLWSYLTDGGAISGATTDTLNLGSVGLTTGGQYRTIASNGVGNTTNTAGILRVLNGSPDVTQPGDPVSTFGSTRTLDGGPPAFIDNNVGSKCLIPDLPLSNPVNCGFIVTPSMSSTVLRGIRLYTANDAAERDPSSLVIEGSNDEGNTWIVILPETALALPADRNTGTGVPNPATHFMQEVNFTANTAGYLSYRITFVNLKATPGMMQLAEAELLGVANPMPPMIIRNPNPTVTTYVGGAPTFGITAKGSGPITYRWFMNNAPILNATNSSYTFPNAQVADAGKAFRCEATNPYGFTNSTSGTFTTIPKPTQAYPVAIITDQPIGFWRLAESPDDGVGNNGLLANDYMGGHIGVYSNVVIGVPGYNSTSDPNTAATFGTLATQDSYVGSINDVNFATATGTSASFSVEAWVNGLAQGSDAGIVTKGFGGFEQFNLDTGGGGASVRNFRFYMRDASGGIHGPSATQGPDGQWHHVVGVYDADGSNVVLYVDGIQNAITPNIPGGLGVLETAAPVSIGSRKSGATSTYNNQFNGIIDEVAIYNHALGSNQVLTHYYAANPGAKLTLQPTNTAAPEGGTATLYSLGYGPGTVSYQWYQSSDFGATFAPMNGKTSANLVIPGVPAAYNLYQYQVTAANAYGSATSSIVTLSVVSGAPFMTVDLPPARMVYAGRTITLTVAVDGSAPFSYQWTSNDVVLADSGRFTGTKTNTLTIANVQLGDAANYQVQVSNNYGTTPSSVLALSVTDHPSFAQNGLGWSLNGGATFTSGALDLTENMGGQARSSFFQEPLYIGNFSASFIYQNVTGGGADGFSLCVQNDPRGASALGGAGGALGLSDISPSAALTFNIYNISGVSFGVNGGNGNPYTPVAPIDFSMTDQIYVSIVYINGVASLTLVDSNTIPVRTFSAALPVGSLAQIVGADTAYVGVTGATGGASAQQRISNFTFIPYPAMTATLVNPTTLALTWTDKVAGYKLQQRASLTTGNWQTVEIQPSQVNGQNQITVSPPTGMGYYRLVFE